jgi:DNA-binding XRE family transcriptional regulator
MKAWSYWTTIVVVVLNLLLRAPGVVLGPTAAIRATVALTEVVAVFIIVLVVLPSSRSALETPRTTIGHHMEELRRIRRMRGLSQLDLAALSGVSQYTITEVETGRREPRPSTLRKLADALEVEVADFFQESEPPKALAPS